MRSPIPLVVLLAFALVLSGCLAGDDAPGEDPQDDASSDGDGSGADGDGGDGTNGSGAGDNSTQDGEGPELNATIEDFDADPTSGEAPLNVTFTWEVDTNDDDAEWSLAFGDDSSDDGLLSDAPESVVHAYDDGNFSTVFTVTFGDNETVAETVNLTIEAPATVPDELVFEYGPSLGCVGDTPCISELLGPDMEPIDGYWQELDESYWGLSFTMNVESVQGDSDCTAYNADLEAIGDFHNAGDPCGGILPEGAKWLFMYAWIDPATAGTLEFSP